jgi:hypothetical protein
MKSQDFSAALVVDQTPQEAFDAITNVRGWWSEEIDGASGRLNDEFTYRLKDLHRCTVRLTAAIPGRRVAWLVLENYFDFTQDKSEWTGTEITFDISEEGDQTKIEFTHRGLVPEYECFDVCSNAWGFYINGSLRNLITTGTGQPNKRESIASGSSGLPS